MQTDIAGIWDRLTILSDSDDHQNVRISKLERQVIQLSLADELLFPLDSARLRPQGLKKLEKVATVLREYPDMRIVVSGHTDSTGSTAHNRRLSEQRAETVADVLKEFTSED